MHVLHYIVLQSSNDYVYIRLFVNIKIKKMGGIFKSTSVGFENYLLSVGRAIASSKSILFKYAQVRIPSMLSFRFLHFYCIIFSYLHLNHVWTTVFLTFIQSVPSMRY